MGTLKVKHLLTHHVPSSWRHVKAEHLKRAANSRKERLNNCHPEKVAEFCESLRLQKRHAEPTIHQPIPEDITPPWNTDAVAQNDATHTVSVEQAAHSPPDKPEPLAERNGGFMEQVHLMRQTRQDVARAEHHRSSGFMHDVTNQRLGASQYYERHKLVLHSNINKRLSDTMYANRRAYYQYLYKHGDVCVHTAVTPRPLPDLKNSDSSSTAATPSSVKSASEEAFACMYHNYTNREFWNGPPQKVPAKPYRFPETAEIISRAEQRIACEDRAAQAALDSLLTQDMDGLDAKMYKAWMRGHELRKESVFDQLLYRSVRSPVHFARYRHVWATACKRKSEFDRDAVRLAWWLNAYQHRRFNTVDSIIRWSVISRLQPSKPTTIDVFSQCNNLMQKAWRALNRADHGSLRSTMAQMTKGMLLPSTHVTNRDPAMAQPRGKS
jgi:hypothetical protein